MKSRATPVTAQKPQAQRAAPPPAGAGNAARAERLGLGTTRASDKVPTAPVATPDHPWLAKAGEYLGLGLGVAVTEGLALVPGWNDRLVDEDGNEVQAVPGAERQGDHPLRKRHEEVVGPQVNEYAAKQEPGWWHDLVGGFGAGASEAPGASYRLEAGIEDMFEK